MNRPTAIANRLLVMDVHPLGLRWALVTAAMFLAPVAGCLMAALKRDGQPLRREE